LVERHERGEIIEVVEAHRTSKAGKPSIKRVDHRPKSGEIVKLLVPLADEVKKVESQPEKPPLLD